MAKVTIEVLRPFLLEGARLEIGEQAEVSPALAAELESAHKARRLAAPIARGPMTTETASAVVAGKRGKKTEDNL